MLDVRLRKDKVPAAFHLPVNRNTIRISACLYFTMLVVCAPVPSRGSDGNAQAEAQVPDAIASEMVRIAIEQTIDRGVAATPMLVSTEDLELSWLEDIDADRVRVLTRAQVLEMDRMGESYYSFTEPAREVGGKHCLGLLYGTRCNAEGLLYRFRVSEGGLELWRKQSGISRMC